ncbi:MAG TPA: threonine ammonia-lyase [Candidatus Acidoferrales bacterium]|nr:threonine ammonia-lyase [Candidatus Acidoferrales bacterium]
MANRIQWRQRVTSWATPETSRSKSFVFISCAVHVDPFWGTIPLVNLQEIQAAAGRIRNSILVSPFERSEAFSQLTGNAVFLKLENHQMTGAFKERGALNKILLLTPEERQRGVIAASAGNHAQAVAYHAAKRGIRAQICMPLTTPLVKVSATQGYGAEVILSGANYDEACAEALRRCAEQKLTFIHPFDDPAVIAGQGTLGLEMLEQAREMDAVVVPVGGGGLIAGVACAVKETCAQSGRKIQVIGVQTSKLPSMKAAVESGRQVTLAAEKTIADGIAVRVAGEQTLPLVRKYVDDIVTVDDEEIANAILLLLEKEKTLSEGAGAVAAAAVLNQKAPLRDKKVGVVVSGGNIDVTLLSRIIERGLVKDGRLLRMRIHLPDHPGALVRLSSVIAQHHANIIETSFNRAYFGVVLGDTAIDITMETRGPEHIKQLIAALDAAGYVHERVQ